MRHSPPPLMLFAAGFGTRMRPLTDRMPKPLISVAGRALIDHALDVARAAGITRIVANLHYLPEQIERHLAGSGVITVREEPTILETGGGLRNALPLLGSDTVITMNTDAIWVGPNPIAQLLERWDPARMDALLSCIPVQQARGHPGTGDFRIDEDGRLHRGPGTVYGGVQIMRTARLNDVPNHTFSLNVVWNAMASDNRLFGVSYSGTWCDVGRAENISEAEAMIGAADV